MAKKTIEVEDYYDKVHQTAWPRRTAGLIGGAAVGVIIGGIIGTLAAFLPFVFGAIGMAGAASVTIGSALAAVPGTAAVFAGMGGLMLSAAMATVGSDSGAVAAGLAEKEKREKLGGEPGHTADIKIIPGAKQPMPKLFNWKVAAVTVPVTATFGALIALHPATASAISMLGFQGATVATATAAAAPASTAAIAATASVFGMLGTAFGMKMAYLTNQASNLAFKVLNGKIFEPAVKAPAPEAKVEIANSEAVSFANEPTRDKPFSADKMKFSLQNVIEKNEQTSEVLITR